MASSGGAEGDAAATDEGGGGDDAEPVASAPEGNFSVSPVELLHFRAIKEDKTNLTVYCMDFAQDNKRWSRTRRYTEFLRCHVMLLETYSRKQLPPFPPKEPIFRKVFRRDTNSKPAQWEQDRKVYLYEYMSGLLENPRLSMNSVVLRFVGAQPEISATGIFTPFEDTICVEATLDDFLGPSLAASSSSQAPPADASAPVSDAQEPCGADEDEDVGQEDAACEELGGGEQDEAAAVEEFGSPGDPSSPGSEGPPSPDDASADNSPRDGDKKKRTFRKGDQDIVYSTQLTKSEAVHKVFGFRGNVAAAYAKQIEANQRQTLEKAPMRLQKTESGSVVSVPVKFSVVKAKEEEASSAALGESTTHRSLQEVENDRKEKLLQQVQMEERQVADWIHQVTGDEQAAAAAAGECSLLHALRSGEALCDLVNAIWPGRIVGVRRGQTVSLSPRSSRRRLANISHFVQACAALGVPESNIPVPSDIAEGKNSRSVLRCIYSLGKVVPDQDYDGPRLASPTKAPAVDRQFKRRASSASAPLSPPSSPSEAAKPLPEQ